VGQQLAKDIDFRNDMRIPNLHPDGGPGRNVIFEKKVQVPLLDGIR